MKMTLHFQRFVKILPIGIIKRNYTFEKKRWGLKLRQSLLIVLFLIFNFSLVNAQKQRFPKPEFATGYEQPSTITPEPRALALEYFDVVVLLVVLSLASWLVVKKRSRQ